MKKKIQKIIKEGKCKTADITKDMILDRLKGAYPREQFPWSRYAFRNAHTLPAKRSYGRRSDVSKNKDQLTRPSIAEPERWSAPDVAAQWTHEWFYREDGHRYDLRAIRKLLKHPDR